MHKALLALPLLVAACGGLVPGYGGAAYATNQAQIGQASVDDVMTQRLATARAAAKAGGANEAWKFGKEVENVFQTGMVTRGKADGPSLVTEASGYLDAAASTTPAEAPKLLAEKGSLLFVSGDKAGAKQALLASFATPNLWPVEKLLAIYDADGEKPQITSTCTKARAVTKSDDEKYALLDVCLEYAHASSLETGLAWAPKGDVAFYKQRHAQEDAKAAQDAQAAREKSDADRKALYASFNHDNDPKPASGGSSGSTSGSSSSSGPVSVTIRSSCPQTARVFYGSKPKFGSGTTSSISSNSVNSHSFQSGDMMWVVDESDNGLGSVTVSSSTHEIEINSDCRSLRSH